MSCCSTSKTPLDVFAASLQHTEELELSFPMYVVHLETVLGMEKVRPHQELLKDGCLSLFDPKLGRAMFVSHQWTSEVHPDPGSKQLRIFQKAMRNLVTGKTAAQPNVWADLVFSLAGGAPKSFTASKLTQTPILVWFDYFCIPQYAVTTRSRSLSGNELEDQRSAIASIPAYIDKCDYFVALCPLMQHTSSLSVLNSHSWAQRGWCRAEAVVRDLSVKNGVTMIIESPRQIFLAPTYSMLKAPGDGEFTVPGDRRLVGELVKGVLHQKMHAALRTRDFPKYRFLLNHQAVLLRNSNTKPVPGLLQDASYCDVKDHNTISEDFLLQNGFQRIQEWDKAGWSPLLYAALGGNPEIVEALLFQQADPNDYIRKVQNPVVFVKGTPAVSICAMQRHNKALRVLLRFRASPDMQDPGGSSPLFYVTHSDNVEGAKSLLEARADTSLTSVFGTNAFDMACAMGASGILKEVFEEPPHAASQQEALGLAMSIGHGNPDTVLVLLEMGCDNNGVVSNRNAAAKLFAGALQIKHKVSPTSLTSVHYHGANATPLMRSILSGSHACAHLLIESKARVDLRNSKGRTAFDLAVMKHAPDSLLWDLWRHGAGDHASKASVAWWSANAPERFPVTIGELPDFASPGVSRSLHFHDVYDASSDEESSEDPMVSIYF